MLMSLALLSGGARAEIAPVSRDQCRQMQASGVMPADAPVGCDRLRNVSFQYLGFENEPRMGTIVVLDALAPRVQAIFDALRKLDFPLQQAVPIEHFSGDDDASMNANNTSAFNARPISGGSAWSLHAFGAAIDLNPIQNPYIVLGTDGVASVRPPAAARTSVNRFDDRPDKPKRPGMAEAVVDVFADNGFIGWGGYWNFPIDYQHFEIGSRGFAQRLARASPDEAGRLFEAQVTRYADCMRGAQGVEHAAARAACVTRVWQ
ncbi:M15 family metallopeptidase [Burkholderia sp. FERM BP-3421]|jgi:hypothetical protein|uniref:M15 family metallopeptidase n=1 Tax=Burkholderia sp. FERM BP-3421 TaxID=1494466 RepID=UPI00235DD223|nr:M15 family metallopeptidase [Burkholderia sp. FERM BP-3421]WDD92070.1 M15 family metallopeptidase [Burkholderia sp. FERM BP-3421]